MTRVDITGAVIGFLALEYGLALWSTPAAWIIGGGMVLVAALWPTARKAAR